MKYLALPSVILAFLTNIGNGFIVPSGLVVCGTPPDSVVFSAITSEGAVSGCCPCCTRSTKNGSSTGAFFSSGSVRRRSCRPECRCGVCSMRTQALGRGRECVDGASIPPSLQDSPRHCPSCVASCCAESCKCPICLYGRGRSILTVMKAGKSQVPESVPEAVSVLRQRLAQDPASITFDETLTAIAEAYDYTPKMFVNGGTSSKAGTNAGSCKVFSFGKIAGLTPEEVLVCFGEHFRSVVANPSGEDHGNIRTFMKAGWAGIDFPDGLSLTAKGD